MTTNLLHEVVEVQKVSMVSGKADSIFSHSVGQMYGVVFPDETSLGRQLHVMSCLPQ